MVDAPTEPATSEPPIALRDALVLPLPPLPQLGGFTIATVGKVLVGLGLAISAWVVAFSITRRTPAPGVLGLMIVIALTTMALTLVLKGTTIRRRLRLAVAEGEPIVGRIVACADFGDVLRPMSTIQARWQRLLGEGQLGAQRPRAVVDREIAAGVASLSIPTDLIEPEIINESDIGNRIAAAMFTVFGVQRLIPPLNQDWPWGVFFLCMALVMMARIPAIRDRIPLLRDFGSNVVAGPGWVRDRRGRLWRADDSVAIITAMRQRRSKRRGVRVRLVGPMGVRDVRFERTDNADLRVFWERWMHASPRPEFADAE